jgi:peptidoglycan hydrolase-like protein with peptidoglycan-binding domain
MTRLLLSIALLIGSLAVPAFFAWPRVANAIGIDGGTTRLNQQCLLYQDDAVGACVLAPIIPCPITNVGASVNRDGTVIRGEIFNYSLRPPCNDVRVHGSYSPVTGDLAETLDTGNWKVQVVWNCTGDPWTAPSGNDLPACTRISMSAKSIVDLSIDPSYPMSVGPLSDLSRQTLNGQLQNAIKQSEPAPAPKPQAPPPPPKPQESAPPLLTVKRGSSAPGVEAVQYLLRHHGADIVIDGDFGDQTEGAVKDFQQANGLSVTGVVNEKTWRALWVTLKQGDQNDAVSAAQTLLNRHRFDVVVDGDFGDQTDGAVRAFQEKKGLPAGGVVDDKTWEALCVAVAGLGVRSSE